jgi:hypothetical protein
LVPAEKPVLFSLFLEEIKDKWAFLKDLWEFSLLCGILYFIKSAYVYFSLPPLTHILETRPQKT